METAPTLRQTAHLPPDLDRLLSVREVANKLGIAPITVLRHIRSGDLKAIDFGTEYLIHSDEVERFRSKGYKKTRGRRAKRRLL
ncbi:MAG: hypothetical protein A2172_04870 [Candidatus Woykebacteria bacterium RBG_13_40_15]|uniref:Helix-turn-helix domain-containing protein n=1 Tax=Candidatus Woykebacteria bacterium RBG_13_40_15 TaxID=1802593 RepID=A0A1G1W760_9BACT|nr:MAG: hypothetical protein A2172_04870 [Candidatus Woykebacteria bacterium RBG_13_40_15]